jgi:putative endonuclease
VSAGVAGSGTPSTYLRGRAGERRAVAFLEGRGYQIVEKNFRCRAGEIDLVAREGGDLVFVEVRTRADARRGSALETVRAPKRAKVARVAEAYLAMRSPAFSSCRFDVVGITGDDIELIKDAFRLGS